MKNLLSGLEKTKDQTSIIYQRLKGISSCSSCKVLTFQIAEDDDRKFKKWLSDIRYTDDHEKNFKDILENTGGWLLEDPEFKKWMEGGSVLWLRGIR
jgi:hypothetical protein